MCGSELCAFSFWWIVPVVMMILCFFMMRGSRGRTMSDFGCCSRYGQKNKSALSARDILDGRYASGDIDKAEYEDMKRTLTNSVDADENRNEPNEGDAK